MSMKRSRGDVSMDVVIYGGFFKNNVITVISCFMFIPKTGMRLLKQEFLFTVFVSGNMKIPF